jgi:hypothetical protein
VGVGGEKRYGEEGEGGEAESGGKAFHALHTIPVPASTARFRAGGRGFAGVWC